MPVIQLDKDTKKRSSVLDFENVNTGGVPLTVFELVTASFFTLKRSHKTNFAQTGNPSKPHSPNVEDNLLKEVSGANFLAAMSSLITYDKRIKAGEDEKFAVSCKKQDILNLKLDDYLKFHDRLVIW